MSCLRNLGRSWPPCMRSLARSLTICMVTWRRSRNMETGRQVSSGVSCFIPEGRMTSTSLRISRIWWRNMFGWLIIRCERTIKVSILRSGSITRRGFRCWKWSRRIWAVRYWMSWITLAMRSIVNPSSRRSGMSRLYPWIYGRREIL